MYCKNCGKFIGTDASICDECKQQRQASFNQNTTYQTTNPYNNAGYYQPPTIQQDTTVINLGKAIASAILSTIGFIFIYVGLISATSIYDTTTPIVCMMFGLVPSILGLVFGCQSISNFKQTAHIKNGKRIPVMILGISSVVNSGISLFFSFILICIMGSI